MWCRVALALAVTAQAVNAKNIEATAIDYLAQYGYVETFEGSRPSSDEAYLRDAVKKFQEFAGLKKTGIIDKETEELMQTPRCGLDDRVANFVARDRKWEKRELTYRIFTYPTNGISRQDVDTETTKAFAMWQEVSNMRFSKRSFGPVDIEISFAKGAHGDQNPFNGPGGVLAHAYFPGYGAISGDAHFDDAENWSVTPNRGNQLLNTLTHEFGHSLGLEHSNVRGSIMAPFYKGWDINLRLIDDDIKGIQYLYGKPTKNVPVTIPPVTGSTERPPQTDKKMCHSKIDTIVHLYGGTSYVFIGDDYWKLTDDDVAPGYPRKISQDWSSLPGKIDAAVTWRARDVTYFFKGDKYWRFTGQTPSSGYPKHISNWPGLPANLDAAFQWGNNNDLYFFKGSQYWKYDTDRQTMDDSYPRDISIWKGVPSDIDAAFQWKNGKTFFFKSGKYWRFNDASVAVDRSDPPYPRDAGQWWFGCPKEELPPIPKHGRIEIDKEP